MKHVQKSFGSSYGDGNAVRVIWKSKSACLQVDAMNVRTIVTLVGDITPYECYYAIYGKRWYIMIFHST